MVAANWVSLASCGGVRKGQGLGALLAQCGPLWFRDDRMTLIDVAGFFRDVVVESPASGNATSL